MKLIEMTVEQYLDTLTSDAPAPGGGSASALSGAQGAGLTSMAAALTVGKKKYAENWDFCADIRDKAAEIRKQLTAQIDRDTEAFNLVSAAFKLPKETDEEKASRAKAIAEATVVATEEPLHTMELALDAIQLAHALLGKFNTNCASDLGVAALSLKAAADGAYLNVLINLSGITTAEQAESYRERAGAIRDQVSRLSVEIIGAVVGYM